MVVGSLGGVANSDGESEDAETGFVGLFVVEAIVVVEAGYFDDVVVTVIAEANGVFLIFRSPTLCPHSPYSPTQLPLFSLVPPPNLPLPLVPPPNPPLPPVPPPTHLFHPKLPRSTTPSRLSSSPHDFCQEIFFYICNCPLH
ncbi:unnamed protein product [Closterium sp. NIES-53]